MDEEERNPFTLPSDEEVFKMRDEEKRRKKEYRETQSKLKVWEKTTRGKLPTGAISASRGATAVSRRRRASSPGEQARGGLFFDFEAIRTDLTEMLRAGA